MSNQKQARLAVLSMLGFVLLWAVVTDAWNHSAVLSALLPPGLGGYLYGYVIRLVWVLPAFVLIRRFEGRLCWGKKQLLSAPGAEPLLAVFLLLTTVYGLILAGQNPGFWQTAKQEFLLVTLKFLIVAVVEETVFRGWGYNLLQRVRPGAAALLLSSALFAVLHWPAYLIRWFLYGWMDWAGLAAQSASVFFCGILFSLMLKRSGSLWGPILAHFYYDWVLELLA